jgi:purine nucleosidase
MVHKYPHQITIYAGGPMTNLAPAVSIDPELVNTPRHEFNLWFDPEAAHIVLFTPWKKIVCTTVDISVKTRLTQELIDQATSRDSAAAHCVRTYAKLHGKYNYLWDELPAIAWLETTIITTKSTRYLDMDLSGGAGYGDTLSWTEQDKPTLVGPPSDTSVDNASNHSSYWPHVPGLCCADSNC